MRVPALETVRMLGRHLPATPCGHANHQRNGALATGHVAQGRCVVHDLVERQQAEIDGHDFDHRPQSTQRRTNARAHETRFRQRRIANTRFAKLGQQTFGDGIAPPITTDVLPHEKDPRIGDQGLAQTFAQCFAVGDHAAGSA